MKMLAGKLERGETTSETGADKRMILNCIVRK
jgi:hypothetical protein